MSSAYLWGGLAVSAGLSCAQVDRQAFARAHVVTNDILRQRQIWRLIIEISMDIGKVKKFTSRGLVVAASGWAAGVVAAVWLLSRTRVTQYVHVNRRSQTKSIDWPWWQHEVEVQAWYFYGIATAMVGEYFRFELKCKSWKASPQNLPLKLNPACSPLEDLHKMCIQGICFKQLDLTCKEVQVNDLLVDNYAVATKNFELETPFARVPVQRCVFSGRCWYGIWIIRSCLYNWWEVKLSTRMLSSCGNGLGVN